MLAGTWITEGEILNVDDPANARLHAVDTYEWFSGSFFLLHRASVRLGAELTQSVEIIGYDRESQSYITTAYDQGGNVVNYRAALNGNEWKITGDTERFTGQFGNDRRSLTGTWERRDEGRAWAPWMHITLTKVSE